METAAVDRLEDCKGQTSGQTASDRVNDGISDGIIKIRKATQKDVPVILKFITGLALYQKEHVSAIEISEKELLRDGFGDHPYFNCLIAEHVISNNINPVGFVLYYFGYSTRTGRILYLEDIYVEPDHRRRGVATLMMKELCKVAVDNKCRRIEWVVLDWNKDASSVYDKWGSNPCPDLLTYRMTQDTILKHASIDDNGTSV